jgi:hypothetical protein
MSAPPESPVTGVARMNIAGMADEALVRLRAMFAAGAAGEDATYAAWLEAIDAEIALRKVEP